MRLKHRKVLDRLVEQNPKISLCVGAPVPFSRTLLLDVEDGYNAFAFTATTKNKKKQAGIFIGKPLFDLCASEGQLAFILGHELHHLTHMREPHGLKAELNADRRGLEYLHESGYHYKSALKIIDVLEEKIMHTIDYAARRAAIKAYIKERS